MPEFNARSLLKFDNSRIAVITENGEHYSYEDLLRYSDELSSCLKPKSLIFNFCENNIESLVGYLAFAFEGHAALLINSKQHFSLTKSLIDKYSPDYIWINTEQKKYFSCQKVVFSLKGYHLLDMEQNTVSALHKDLSLLLPTSGSTGSSKYVKLTLNNIISNAKSIAQYLNLNETERPVTSLPMHYSFGLSVINSHLVSGSTILLTKFSFFQKEFWSFLKNFRATSISGTPFHFAMLDRLGLDNLNRTEIRVITHAGGKMNPDLLKKMVVFCDQNSLVFFSMYGQTEATARMSFVPPEKLKDKLGSIGIPIPGGQFELLDDASNLIVDSGVEGDLVYSGENVGWGYANIREDLSNCGDSGRKLHTGDRAIRDDDGYYYIVGRKTRFIKIYGNRINLDDIEDLIHESFGECACIGVDDSIIIYVTSDTKIAEIKAYIAKITGISSRVIEVRFIHKMPRTDNGKLSYSELEPTHGY